MGIKMIEQIPKNKTNKTTKYILILLFFIGIVHWLGFFYLTHPLLGEGGFRGEIAPPNSLIESKVFTMHDWPLHFQLSNVVKEALRTGTLPFHVPNLGKLYPVENRFMGAPCWSMWPQILLLLKLDSLAFFVIDLLLMYSIGFYGCMLIRRYYQLGLIPFTFLFLLFNFNGFFVAKFSAYGPFNLGYFLLPFLFLLMLKVVEPKSLSREKQIGCGILMGFILTAMFLQGSAHYFAHAITFILIWGIVNYKLWKTTLSSLIVASLTSAVRVLPVAVTVGFGANPRFYDYGQYSYPWSFIVALVATKTHLSKPYFAWWEYSLYIGWIGLAALLYFGFWGNYKKRDWAQFKGWGAMAIPCLIMVIISFRRFKQYIIPNFIPLLNSTGNPMRYMIFPLLITIIIAAINMQGFINKYGRRRQVKYLLVVMLIAMAGFLFNHSRLWRLHRVQNEFDRVVANHLWGTKSPSQVILSIVNNMSDTIYIYSFWVGLAISIVAFILVLWWLISNRKKLKG